MKPVHALLQLQQLDSRADAIRARLQAIHDLIEGNAEIRQAASSYEAARDEHSRWRAHYNDLTLQQVQLKDEGDSVESTLYSGTIGNPRELEELQAKLEELRRRHAAIAAPIEEAIAASNNCAEIENAALEQLELVRETETAKQAELVAEQEALQAELDGMASTLASFRANTPPDHLAIYDQLRTRPGGQAVAQLVGDDECSVCGFELTAVVAQQVRRGQAFRCTNCQRLLVP